MEFGSPSLLEDIKETYFFTKGGSLYGCFFLKTGTTISPPDEMDKDTVDVHTVFAVKDIEESLELIEKNGGQRKVAKTSIGPNMGYVARFVDSEGNLMGIYAMN
jgi:predicted enzyme related to lactoylglutathione lyase